jgi:hypothetical protein
MFDRPSLHRSGSTGAKAFLDTLDLRWHGDDEVDDTALGVAAAGLLDVFSDQRESGRARFESLVGARGQDEESTLTRLLGHALIAWSSETSETEIAAAATEAGQLTDDHLLALYLLKLAGFALDAGDRDQARDLIRAGLERVPSQRKRLEWRLTQVAASLDGEILFAPPPEDRDDLADFPWIDQAASGAAQDAVRKIAEATVEDPWRRSFHFGATPVDSITAAVLQAEWAGALWRLPHLRLQQAAMTINAGGRYTEEWERAAANWVLGGGSRLRDVVRSVEPHFEPASTRRLIEHHLVRGRRLRSRDRYLEVLLALWDLLDNELAAEVLPEVQSWASANINRDEAHALWAVLGALVPAVWAVHLEQLAPEQQGALLPHLTVGLVHRLPEPAIRILSERCITAMRESLEAAEPSGPEPFKAAAALLRAPGLDERTRLPLMEFLSRTPRPYQSEIVTEAQELVNTFDVPSLVAEALERIRREASAARQGRYTMYGRPPITSAAEMAIAFPDVDSATAVAEAIFDLALDPSLIVDFRLEALQATYRFALSHEFDDRLASRSGDPTEFRSDPFRNRDDRSFQSALLDCAFYISAPTLERLPVMLAHARDNDARVRRLAVHAIGDDLERRSEAARIDRLLLWSTMVGGLFDPSPSVVVLGLDLIARIRSVPTELSAVVAERLARLFSESGREVRASVVRTAARWTTGRPSASGVLDGVLVQAASDRSWLVRDALKGASEEAPPAH